MTTPEKVTQTFQELSRLENMATRLQQTKETLHSFTRVGTEETAIIGEITLNLNRLIEMTDSKIKREKKKIFERSKEKKEDTADASST